MSAVARTVFLGLDATDRYVAREFARDGSMPVLANLLETAAVQETEAPFGFFVGGTWPTAFTGTSPARHQFLCPGAVRGGTYEAYWAGPVYSRAVWDVVSDAGGRVAVLDAPHAAVRNSLNGVQLGEWGAHDRHEGTKSFPPEFLGEINDKYGAHPVGTRAGPRDHFAPCDLAHRVGDHRTVAENAVLRDEIVEGIRRKTAVTIDVLERGDWDLFYSVFGEVHCAGHQFWRHHDPTHPWHDPAEVAALGGDPLRAVYHAADHGIGEVLARIGDDTTVYVHLSHGMRAHYDGTWLLDPVLWRLDEYASGRAELGGFSRAMDRALDVVPASVRGRALGKVFDLRARLTHRAGPIGTDGRPVDIPTWHGQRRWWAQPNDAVFGSVRLNILGREPNGRIVNAHWREVATWLTERMLELVNVDTGAPAVKGVHFTEDFYERGPNGDPMGDLIVEWNRDAPLDTVWSPATGVVTAPYTDWRSGDHQTGGLLLALGPGIEPGVRPGSLPVVHIGPTLAASLGVDMPDVDGTPRSDLVPSDAPPVRKSVTLPGRRLHQRPIQPAGRRRYASRRFDRDPDVWNEEFAVGLSLTVHDNRVMINALRAELDGVRSRADELARLAAITEVGAWLRLVEVQESLLISVIVPTRNRADLLARAIESVRQQTYRNWELVIVDDASTDETPTWLEKLAADDPRIRAFRFEEHGNSALARNCALDNVRGDVVTYLDDDNRFDPEWLRAVAWAFAEYPDTRVAYGARVIDDDARHRGVDERSLPIIQFLPWDREGMLQANRVDQNVIAHRPTAARYDEELEIFNDWDFLLQLTDDCDPLELPALAAHYSSDAPNRLTDLWRANGDEAAAMAHVQMRARVRRGEA